MPVVCDEDQVVVAIRRAPAGHMPGRLQRRFAQQRTPADVAAGALASATMLCMNKKRPFCAWKSGLVHILPFNKRWNACQLPLPMPPQHIPRKGREQGRCKEDGWTGEKKNA